MSSVQRWRAAAHERAAERGYVVDIKRVVMAYGIELLVIAASLVGALYFARKYGHGARPRRSRR
jgi:hypothetical protein